MGSPVRFPFGVTNVDKVSPLAFYGLPDPAKWHTYFNDFDEYVVTTRWTETKVGAGTVAVTDEDGGVLLITNAAADNDSVFVQKIGESFLPTSGKRCVGRARFKISDATESECYFGLMVTDTDPFSSAAGDGVTDGIFFMKEDGSANVGFYCQKDATTGQLTSAAVTTLATNTYAELAFAFDGKRFITLWKDNVQLVTIDLTATLTTYLPDTELTISFGLKNGEAVAKTMSIDHIFVAQER